MTSLYISLVDIEKKNQEKLSKVLNLLKILWKMEDLLQWSIHSIFKYMLFSKVLLWSKGLINKRP